MWIFTYYLSALVNYFKNNYKLNIKKFNIKNNYY